MLKNNQIKFSKTIAVFLLIILSSCDSNKKASPEIKQADIYSDTKDSKINTVLITQEFNVPEIKLIVIPCSNGYEYSMHGYDINPIIEIELNKISDINVAPFPLKKLMNIPYNGIFDKRYCKPIIENVDTDFLIMTKFVGNMFPQRERKLNDKSDKDIWGYETKILNAKSMRQKKSISAYNLNTYSEIKEHIKGNIDKLKKDIESIR